MQFESITIRPTADSRGYFTVEAGGKASTHLGWDEMLGQIVNLTLPEGPRRLYAMLTPDEQAERERRWVQPVESECDDWSSLELHIPF